MSVTELKLESHQNPSKFRIRYEDASLVLGPSPKLPSNDALPTVYSKSKVGIIGGGFSGIGVALTCLKKLHEDDFVIFDKHGNFGGTWWANTYPGCASDIPALWYSFFEELNSNWTRLRPPQYEMEEYILSIAEKYDLPSHSHFHTIINKAVYNDREGEWSLYARNVKTGQQIIHTCKVLVSGQGGLVVPQQLEAKGLHNFKGAYMHSAVWDYGVSFEGKNVVVVGNGCSASQVVPALLDDYGVKSIVQISRSKHYIMPPLPQVAYHLYKLLSFHRYGLIFTRWLIASVAESRFPLYKGDGLLARAVRWLNTQHSLRYMKTAPEKFHDIIIPNYKVGCKRLIFDYKYIPSLHDPRLDMTNESIDHITEDSVVLSDGRKIKADIIVGCTGYSIKKSVDSYKIIGRNGVDLTKVWIDEGISAYNTVLARDCPNMFFIAGPNSATGHSSVVLAAENGCAFFARVAPKILDGTYKSICVKSKEYYQWFHTTQRELSRSVFGTAFGGCRSWYSDDKVNSTTYPYSQIHYWWSLRHPQWDDFDLEESFDYESAGKPKSG